MFSGARVSRQVIRALPKLASSATQLLARLDSTSDASDGMRLPSESQRAPKSFKGDKLETRSLDPVLCTPTGPPLPV